MAETFPFQPNWSDSVEVTLSFKTDMFTSRSGLEQRRALRLTPRREISFKALTYTDLYRQFMKTLAIKQALDFDIPDWSASVAPITGATSGSTTVTTKDIVPDWMVAGRKVFITENDLIVPVTVSAASGSTVLFSSPVTANFTAKAVIRRAATGLLGPVATRLNTSNVVTAEIKFSVAPTTYPNSGNPFFAYVTGGKEVFSFPWNWGEDVSSQYDWPVEQVDFGRGVVSNYRIQDFGRVTQRVTVVRIGSQINRMLGFLERQQGQRGEFWMPSGTDDLTLNSNIAAGDTLIHFTGGDAAATFSETYCGVALFLRDGRKVFRRLSACAMFSGNSRGTVAEPFTFAITPAMVAKVCWLRPSRLASDDATIEYITDSVAQWQPTTVSLPYRSDTQDYATLDGAALSIMDNWGDESDQVFDPLQFLVNVRMPGVMG